MAEKRTLFAAHKRIVYWVLFFAATNKGTSKALIGLTLKLNQLALTCCCCCLCFVGHPKLLTRKQKEFALDTRKLRVIFFTYFYFLINQVISFLFMCKLFFALIFFSLFWEKFSLFFPRSHSSWLNHSLACVCVFVRHNSPTVCCCLSVKQQIAAKGRKRGRKKVDKQKEREREKKIFGLQLKQAWVWTHTKYFCFFARAQKQRIQLVDARWLRCFDSQTQRLSDERQKPPTTTSQQFYSLLTLLETTTTTTLTLSQQPNRSIKVKIKIKATEFSRAFAQKPTTTTTPWAGVLLALLGVSTLCAWAAAAAVFFVSR